MSKVMKKCSVVVLSAWIGMGMGVQEAMAGDPVSDAEQILEYLTAIVTATQSSAISLDSLELIDQNIADSTDSIDTSTKSIDKTTLEHWDAMKKKYDMTQETNYSFEYDVNNPNPNVQGQYTELWSPDDWNQALQTASGGNGTRYEQLKAAYEEKNPSLVNHSINDEAVDADKLVKNSYTQVAQTTTAALAVSQHAYEDVNERIRNLKKIMSFIDDQNVNQNEKAAIDLNSRLVAELGLIQLEMLRLQGAQAQMQASEAQDAVNHATIEKQMLGINL